MYSMCPCCLYCHYAIYCFNFFDFYITRGQNHIEINISLMWAAKVTSLITLQKTVRGEKKTPDNTIIDVNIDVKKNIKEVRS